MLIKKEEKEKSWRKSVNIARFLKIYERNDLTFFTQVAIFGRINCKEQFRVSKVMGASELAQEIRRKLYSGNI